jgi:hypothetical protein
MSRGRWTGLSVWLTVLVMILTGSWALGGDTEEQLLRRIESENNPVKKAKDEIKLARMKLTQVHNAYSQGQIEAGVKLLGAFNDDMKTSWKLLQDSGRKAAKQPEGFRELEIELREDTRTLQDLGRTVSYFDRAALTNTQQELEQTRREVIHALFPGGNSKNRKDSPPPPVSPRPESPANER